MLSAERRAAALRWAERHDGLIVEDDYDAEYRYDGAPIGAVQGLAPDRVIYAGTASKTLAPGLRLGWLVAPAHLFDAVAQAKAMADRGSPVLDRLAFADCVRRGQFDRHLRRMRPVYRRRRRDALLTLCAGTCPISSRPGSPPACTSSRTSRTTSTNPTSSGRRQSAGSPSTDSPVPAVLLRPAEPHLRRRDPPPRPRSRRGTSSSPRHSLRPGARSRGRP